MRWLQNTKWKKMKMRLRTMTLYVQLQHHLLHLKEAIGDEDVILSFKYTISQLTLPLGIQESLVRQPNPNVDRKLDVEYNILLSLTYQVPVLYFSLIDRSARTPRPAAGGLDVVYDQVVPARFRTGLKDVGVLGGISVGVCLIFIISFLSFFDVFVLPFLLRRLGFRFKG